VSNLGDGVFLVALPLLAASITRSPAKLSAVVFAGRLPWLLFALVSGALVDRWDRKRVMWMVDAGRFAIVGGLAWAVAADVVSIPLLVAASFLLGVGETLFDSAAQSIVPAVVGRDSNRLERANGRMYSAEIAANQFLGPPAGGFLFAASRAVPFLADAVSFAASSALVVGVRARSERPPRVERRSLRREIGEGVRWLWANRLLRTLAAMTGVMNMGSMAGEAVLVLLAKERFGLGPVGFGLLSLGGAVGSVAGSLLASRLARHVPAGPFLLAAAASSGLSTLAIGLSTNGWMAGAAFALGGFGALAWNVVAVSLRQSIIPDRLLGRVNSVYRLLAWGTMPIGAAIGGGLATVFGLRAAFVIPGAAMLALPVVCAPVVTTAAVNAARANSREAISDNR